MTTFRVGQEVVCVDDGKQYPDDCLEAGRVYIIRELRSGFQFESGIGLAVRLEGVHRLLPMCFEHWRDGWWVSSRFRPVAKRKTDISIFKAMLNPVPQKQDA